jgi:3-hydroxybutyryl-CoA dehydrogenase
MELSKVGVIGAGMMGTEIALVCALSGREVKITDADAANAHKAIEKIRQILTQGISRGFYTEEQMSATLGNLTVSDGIKSYYDRDLIIEAAFENEQVKASIYRELENIAAPDCIIATNTSTLSITALSGSLSNARRARFLGTHFFSPVSRMKLVEVIPGEDTDAAITTLVADFMKDIGKVPVLIKDVVGFAVNRILHMFIIEAIRLVEEGVATPQDIDIACKLGLGHPVGPFELMDGVTTSLTLDAQQIMFEHYGDRFLPRPMLKSLVKAGRTGRKSGRGWYQYRDGKRI